MNLRLELDLMLRRHGWPLVLGAALLGWACVIALPGIVPRGNVPAVVEATDGSRQLEMHYRDFRTILIPRDDIDARQRDVVEMAVRYGLAIGRIDYADESRESGPYGMATLRMPLRGSYTDLRGFLASVLKAHPALAVEEFALQRDPAGNGIEARLKLVFLAVNAENVRR